MLFRSPVRHWLLILLAGLVFCSGLHAGEFFVRPGGSDTAEGTSVATAFATIAKGVTVLKPGDTLTIQPGTYAEAVTARISGTAQEPITIRAARAGTVLIRGDRDVSEFSLAPGFRYTHVTPFQQRVEGVVERDVRFVYSPKLSIEEEIGRAHV